MPAPRILGPMKAMRFTGLCLTCVVACSSAEEPGDGGSGGRATSASTSVTAETTSTDATTASSGEGGNGGAPGVVWGPCPDGFRDECATVAMPLDHDDPDGETIDVFLSRHGSGAKQLWLLQGGPGGSAEVFEGLLAFLDMVDPDLTIYTLEHRGVGDSTRMGCAAEGPATPGGWQVLPEEWPACRDELVATWGDRLRFFSATQAAHDLAAVVDATRAPGQQVFVYGGSYGTLWANRYAVLHPDQPTGIILDAPFQPGATSEYYDLQFEPVGMKVFEELCPGAPACAEHLGPEPAVFLDETFALLGHGHCSELGVDVPTWKAVYGVFLMDYNLRNWLPALTYRLHRCSSADMSAIATLFNQIFGGGNEVPRRSFALQVHIVLSEMWPATHVDDGVVSVARDTSTFFQDALAAQYQMQDTWPRYAPGPRDLEYAPAEVPVLTLAGEDDPACPPAVTGYGYRDNLTGPHQTFVEIPYGAHTVLTAGFVAAGPSCSVQLVRAFLADPTSELPVACAAEVLHPSFDAPQQLANQFFGTDDLYD